MSCHRCHKGDCPTCVTEVDCVRCGTPTDIDHTDDRGRCAGCVEELIAAALAEAVDDATVQPEVIRVAAEAARADERSKCAAICDEIERLHGTFASGAIAANVYERATAAAMAADRCAREIRARGVSP